MKKFSWMWLWLGIPGWVQADTTLTVVGHYDRSGSAEVWQAPSGFRVPDALIEEVAIETPNRAFSAPYPEVFLQNERVVVCGPGCEGPQVVAPTRTSGGELAVKILPPSKRSERDLREAALRQTTVYHWVTRVLRHFEDMGHVYSHRLTVFVDRQITDPESGDFLTNNAFFLSTRLNYLSWSLSFLPAERAPGVNFLPTGYDPSVAMHEATHFVFQELVGEILNPEVYGLHEAFADYFSMATLDSPDIGQVMMKGRPLRSARELLLYKPNMEAHDLGNVVVAALWNIRQLFDDKTLADKITFRTIKEISEDPFATAGAVVPAHKKALLALGGEALQKDPTLATRIEAIWTQTQLSTPELTINFDAITNKPLTEAERDDFVTISMAVHTPDKSVVEFGLPPLTNATLSLITTRPGPFGTSYEWLLVGLQDLDAPAPSATPLWILYDPQTAIIRAAATFFGEPITLHSQEMEGYKNLLRAAENLPSLLNWNQDFGKDYLPLLQGRRWSGYKKRGISERTLYFRFGYGDELLPMTAHEYHLRPSVLLRIVSALNGGGADTLRVVRLYTVDQAHLTSERLPQGPKGEQLVGYEIEKKTSWRLGLRLEDLGGVVVHP